MKQLTWQPAKTSVLYSFHVFRSLSQLRNTFELVTGEKKKKDKKKVPP